MRHTQLHLAFLGEIPRNGINGSVTPGLHENSHSPLLYFIVLALFTSTQVGVCLDIHAPSAPQVPREICRRQGQVHTCLSLAVVPHLLAGQIAYDSNYLLFRPEAS